MSRRRLRRPAPTTDQRPPEQRLEALVREPSRERKLRIMGRIRRDLDERPEPAPWIDAARSLRDRLVISDRIFYYFVEIFFECITFAASNMDAELVRLRDAMRAIERAHGLEEDDFWTIGEATDEWRALNDAWNRRADEIRSARLREWGHADIADFIDTHHAEFDDMGIQGHTELFGEDPFADHPFGDDEF